MVWERIREIIIKELKQSLREPRLRATLFLPPLIQLLVFGFAVSLDVDHARIGWMDLDRTTESRDLREAFTGSGGRRFFLVQSTPGRDLQEDLRPVFFDEAAHFAIDLARRIFRHVLRARHGMAQEHLFLIIAIRNEAEFVRIAPAGDHVARQ